MCVYIYKYIILLLLLYFTYTEHARPQKKLQQLRQWQDQFFSNEWQVYDICVLYIYIYAYVYRICIYIIHNMHTFVCTYIHTYIHTCTHTYIYIHAYIKRSTSLMNGGYICCSYTLCCSSVAAIRSV